MEGDKVMKDKNDIVMIPFVAHESAMNRMERANKRIIHIAISELVVILLMFTSIMIYFYLPTEVIEDDISQNVENINDSAINQKIGE